MSVVKHNTYFKENDGKVYYYDAEGLKKEVPSTAFSNLQEQIDNLGSPLTYSGAQSVDELNELVDIKTGTVYTVTGNSGTLTAGGIDVQPSTEVAWAGEWFNIGKDLDNSWKQWSEDNNTTSNGFDNVYIGDYNKISGNVNYVIGRSNSANENSTDNTIIGNENSIKNENSNTILGRNNTISGNYTNTNTVIGNSNTASGTHNSFIIGEQNATIDQVGAGNSYVLGQNNAAGDCSLTLGTANSSQSGGFYKATLGWENKVGNSNNVVIGGNNTATEKVGKNTIIAGYNNESSGGFAFGEQNKVNADSYAYGYNNSAIEGGVALGKGNSANHGSYAIGGNANEVDYGAYVYGRSNYGKIGFKAIGEGNSGSQGGGAFGGSNIAGKGGYVVGDSNRSYRWDSSTSSYKEIVIKQDSTWENYASQWAFGYNNKINDGYGPYLNRCSPVQIGNSNVIQDHIKYNDVDYYHSNQSTMGNINLGNSNTACNHGINIGTTNMILAGDGSVAASINIGKYLVNRYGVLIGQSITSYGYGFGFGSYIPFVMNGDIIAGNNINANTDNYGNTGTFYARNIFGSNINGVYTSDASVFGSYISGFSGNDPRGFVDGNNWNYTYNGIGYGSIVLGTHIKGAAQYGSMIIAQNGSDADRYGSDDGSIVPIVAEYDSTVIGGYTLNQEQSAYFRKPGISAFANAFILGQGQNMTAGYNSIILGEQSIAKYGSKVFGSHGLAEGASMVLNPVPLSYSAQNVNVEHINGNVITAAPEIYGPYTARGIVYRPSYEQSTLDTKQFEPSGQTFRIRAPINNSKKYYSYFNRTNASNEELSFFAFNLSSDSRNNTIRGYWNSDYTQFIPDESYGYNARVLEWHKGAFLLLRENGENTLYEYNETTSGNGKFPKYVRNSDYWYYYAGYSNYEHGADRIIPPNILSDSIISDGKYIYHIPVWQTGNGNRGWNNISSNIPTSFSGSYCYEASAAYFYSNGTVDLHIPQTITSYGFNGSSGQISTTYSSVYPSAIFNTTSMITNTTAQYGSIGIGPKNSAYGGSIAINTTNTNGSTATHDIEYNTKIDELYCYTFNTTTSSIEQTYKTIDTKRYNGWNISADAKNIAYGASVSIGVGSINKNIIQGASFGVGRNISANGASYVIGEDLYAASKSLVIGFNASASNNSLAINSNIGYGGPTANGGSTAIGAGAAAYNNSFCFNIPLMNNISYNAGYANSGGISIGQGSSAEHDGYAIGGKQYAARHSFALGMKGGTGIFGNRESYDGNYAENISLAIGFNNYARDNSWSIGFNNNVKQFGWTYGFNNYLWGMGMFIGFGNQDWYGSGGYSNSGDSENVDMFGRWNQVVGYIPPSTSTSQPYKSYETTIIGNNNKLIITGVDSLHPTTVNYGYNFAGIFLGKQNESYMADPGGYNIYLGSGNKGCYEAINIGTDNDTMGHSISLGWHNRAVKGGNEHTILIGNGNTAKNTQGYIYSKSYPYINQKILSESEIRQIQTEIAELEEQRTTAYQNSADKANEIYSLLTANGLDSVSANDYINGYTYNSGWIYPGYYQSTPWNVETHSFEYEENGSWYTGYGESAYIKQLVYSYSAYSSYDTTSEYYKYYWLPAKQASATWSIVSSIYTAQYGSDSANRYNAVNTAIQHINELSQSIYTKQYELTQNPITASGTTDSHNIETMSLVVGQGNSADHHNSIVIGSENHTLKMVNTNTYDDDGFTVAIGVGNTVARNYDMAIGYGSFASGGENIAIGTPQQIDEYNVKYTSAIGYKNIAIRSNVEGTNNIAINSILYGPIPGIENDESKQNGNDYLNTILTFSNNVKEIERFNNNKIDNSFITASNTPYFVYNNISDTSAVFSGAHTHNTFEHNTNLILSTPYNSDGIEHNYIGHSNLTANVYETSNNILNNVNGIIASCQQMHRNLIYNTNITATFNEEYRGFSNNLIQNSDVNINAVGFGESFIFDSSVTANSISWGNTTNKNFLVGSRLLINQETFNSANYDNSIYDNISKGGNAGNHVLFGSNVINSYNVFSFSDIYSNNINTAYVGYVQDSCKIFNVFDNITIGATNTVVLGESNRISGPKYTTIIGNNNGILNTNTKTSTRNSLTINGDDNNYIDFTELDDSKYGVSQYNRIYGDYNNFVTTWEGNSTDFITTHNTIIGDCNSYQYMDMDLLSGADTIYEASKKSSYFGKNAALPSILNYGNNKQNRSISQPITAANRNTIIGSHNIISQFINDTILIGSYNVTINEDNRYVKEALKSNNYALGSYNLLRNGSNQIVLGTNNVSTGYNSTAIGEGLISKQSQFVVGRFNEELDGTNGLSADGIDSTSGALFIVGNGKHINDDYAASAVVRSNAMIVSADGTVSATKFATPEIPDIGGSLNNLSELITLLQNKPSTGRHIIGVDNGTLTWLEINQN